MFWQKDQPKKLIIDEIPEDIEDPGQRVLKVTENDVVIENFYACNISMIYLCVHDQTLNPLVMKKDPNDYIWTYEADLNQYTKYFEMCLKDSPRTVRHYQTLYCYGTITVDLRSKEKKDGQN